MREYEFTFVVQPEISEDGLNGVCEKFEGVLAKQGAEKLFYEDWGRRRLAYEIKKFQKGHYMVLHFLNDGTAVNEVERTARLDDSILRFLTVLADEEVKDIDARKAEAVGFEEDRVKKAAERAEREAEEAAARAAEAEAAAEAARAAALAGPAAAAEGSLAKAKPLRPKPARPHPPPTRRLRQKPPKPPLPRRPPRRPRARRSAS